MKKKNGLCLALVLALLLQCLSFAVLATEAGEAPTETTAATTEETTAETTEETTEETTGETTETETATEGGTQAPTIPPEEIPDVPFGTAGVEYGCRTVDAKLALSGSEKLLKTAKSVFVYEANSDTVLYNYNPDERLAPGGLVQIVTALLAIENCDLDQVVTVGTYYINQLPLGVRHVNLRNGEEITVRDLLYCMMLSSANDAAVVLAQVVGGTPESFIHMMNQRVKEMGCTDTALTTISGLDDEQQYTTARDMARIVAEAMKNEDFREIFGTGYHVVEATNKSEARELKSLNYLLEGAAVAKFHDERVTGGKASYTSAAAGATIAFTAQTEELNLVCVIIGATRRSAPDSGAVTTYGNFEEAEVLMNHCFGKFRVGRMLYEGQTMLQLDVSGGANDVVAVNRSNSDIVLPVGTRLEDLTLKYDTVGGTLQAPVKKGQEVATVQMWHGGVCVGETTLYAMNDVRSQEAPGYTVQSGATRSDRDIAQLLLFLGIAVAVILVPVTIYLIINAARKAAARKRARQLRRQRRDQRMQRRRRY